jgi:hypothetical protein
MTYRPESKKFRRTALLMLSLFLGAGERATAQGIASQGTPTTPANQQKFLGKWKLNKAQSKMTHVGDNDKSIQWRSYQRDGARVKVSWGNSEGQVGTYSAKCDNTLEPTSSGRIRCRQVAPDTIEGEQLSNTDKVHRYYRRAVSPDGKTMTITWYADPKRSQETDQFVYTNVSESSEL